MLDLIEKFEEHGKSSINIERFHKHGKRYISMEKVIPWTWKNFSEYAKSSMSMEKAP